MCDLAFLTHTYGHFNNLDSKLQWQFKLTNELNSNLSVFKMKLSLFHPQVLNNDTRHLLNGQKIIKKKKKKTQLEQWPISQILTYR
jgi:hypothetical protein